MAKFTGVVLEKKQKEAIIMTSDGQFKRVKVMGNFDLGEEVTGEEKSQLNLKKALFSFSAAAALLLAVLIPGLMNTNKLNYGQNSAIHLSNQKSSPQAINEVVASVKIEINPSLELQLNEKSIVVAEKALNDDGKSVLAQGTLEGQEVNVAIKKITEWSYSLGYIKAKTNNVIKLTLTEQEKAHVTAFDGAKTQEKLKVVVEEVLEKKGLKGEVKQYHKRLETSKDNKSKVETKNKPENESENKSVDNSEKKLDNTETKENKPEKKSEGTLEKKSEGNSSNKKSSEPSKIDSQSEVTEDKQSIKASPNDKESFKAKKGAPGQFKENSYRDEKSENKVTKEK